MVEVKSPLVGQWLLVEAQDPADLEDVAMEFRADGTLEYSIDLGDRRQIINLTYSVDGDIIVTNQPSKPREERTRFAFGDDGRLELEHEGKRAWYERVE